MFYCVIPGPGPIHTIHFLIILYCLQSFCWLSAHFHFVLHLNDSIFRFLSIVIDCCRKTIACQCMWPVCGFVFVRPVLWRFTLKKKKMKENIFSSWSLPVLFTSAAHSIADGNEINSFDLAEINNKFNRHYFNSELCSSNRNRVENVCFNVRKLHENRRWTLDRDNNDKISIRILLTL